MRSLEGDGKQRLGEAAYRIGKGVHELSDKTVAEKIHRRILHFSLNNSKIPHVETQRGICSSSLHLVVAITNVSTWGNA